MSKLYTKTITTPTGKRKYMVIVNSYIVGNMGGFQTGTDHPKSRSLSLLHDVRVLHIPADAYIFKVLVKTVYQIHQFFRRSGITAFRGNVKIPQVFNGNAHVLLGCVLDHRFKIFHIFPFGIRHQSWRIKICSRMDHQPFHP